VVGKVGVGLELVSEGVVESWWGQLVGFITVVELLCLHARCKRRHDSGPSERVVFPGQVRDGGRVLVIVLLSWPREVWTAYVRN
jgi:hypothetical protein